MDLKRVSRSELVAVAGGILLAIGLFLAWYHIQQRNAIGSTRGPADLTGWQTHTLIRYPLLLAAVAPLILTYILARGHALSWPRGEMTAVIAIVAFGLVLYNGFIDKPGTVAGLTGHKLGIFVALIGSLLMLFGSAARASQVERKRKPPGTI